MRADEIKIPEPCHEDWGRMKPHERGWYCNLCSKNVHDLSAMTEEKARELLDSGEDICVAYDIAEGGDVAFAEEKVVPISNLLRRARPAAAAAAGLAVALAACTPHDESQGPSIDSPDTPTQLESRVVIPEGEREAEPFIRVEIEEPVVEKPVVEEPVVEDEPCETTVVPEPKRHLRGKRIAPRDKKGGMIRRPVKGKPAQPFPDL